ncbi:MAG: substrate-binding domain-containing protein [Agathobacter sp.]|uniref:LacI family DNA-binding transcriptional regulator n=1 Tax=Agathobacter sp. TaxID=2021311 RepID=UPI002E78A2C8|nr:substrate-binding domain-containing protein [Agathobacter sp.]MEE1216235.1 substrate-binding domain-containing protein [Agathobacter sp.]
MSQARSWKASSPDSRLCRHPLYGQDFSSVTRDRLAAYYRALEKHGIDIPEEYVREARYLETEDVAKQTEYLLDLPDKPTCIIYPDDTAAIGGINVIRSRGLRIPEDISIAGYDGTRVSQMLSPKLTTIRQDTDKIGREAADRLVSIIKKPKTALVERAVVEGILLEGESVGRI